MEPTVKGHPTFIRGTGRTAFVPLSKIISTTLAEKESRQETPLRNAAMLILRMRPPSLDCE
jgi:hypothetical protein